MNVDPVAGDIICEWSHHWPDNTLVVRAKVTEIAGQWHHLFVVYDGSSQAAGVRVYVDGRLVPLRVEADRLSESVQVSSPFEIGRRDSEFAFQGSIDDVRIYNRRLSEGEIQQLYVNGLQALAGIPAETRTAEQRAFLSATYRPEDEPMQLLESQLVATETSLHIARWNGVRRWYVNSQGQTMVVIPNSTPEKWAEIDHSYAILTHEVTVAEFLAFRPKHAVDSRSGGRTADCPVSGITWYTAAEYCNWLSKQDGIPKDQWAYEPNAEEKYASGMKIRDYKLRGYRLPTTSEWERASLFGQRHFPP